MNAKLLVVLGSTTKRKVSLKLPAVLGRSRNADITVAHPLISRRHCEITENNGLLMLRDLASLNGTMIGGRAVVTAPLLPQAEFTIGPLTFRVVYEYDGDRAAIPDPHFVDENEGTAAAPPSGQVSTGQEHLPQVGVEEALPFIPASESLSGDFAMPDFMALADADPEQVIPAGPRKPTRPAAKRPRAPIAHGHDEPLEIDSSLQSGPHAQESPWAVELPATKKPPPKENLPPASPPQESDSSGDEDAKFRDFLKRLE